MSLAVQLCDEKYENKKELRQDIEGKLNFLVSSRPTAVNMKIATEELITLANELCNDESVEVDIMKARHNLTFGFSFPAYSYVFLDLFQLLKQC